MRRPTPQACWPARAFWTAKDEAELRAWMGKFLDWLLTSKNGKEEAAMKQNHGTLYDVESSPAGALPGTRRFGKGHCGGGESTAHCRAD